MEVSAQAAEFMRGLGTENLRQLTRTLDIYQNVRNTIAKSTDLSVRGYLTSRKQLKDLEKNLKIGGLNLKTMNRFVKQHKVSRGVWKDVNKLSKTVGNNVGSIAGDTNMAITAMGQLQKEVSELSKETANIGGEAADKTVMHITDAFGAIRAGLQTAFLAVPFAFAKSTQDAIQSVRQTTNLSEKQLADLEKTARTVSVTVGGDIQDMIRLQGNLVKAGITAKDELKAATEWSHRLGFGLGIGDEAAGEFVASLMGVGAIDKALGPVDKQLEKMSDLMVNLSKIPFTTPEDIKNLVVGNEEELASLSNAYANMLRNQGKTDKEIAAGRAKMLQSTLLGLGTLQSTMNQVYGSDAKGMGDSMMKLVKGISDPTLLDKASNAFMMMGTNVADVRAKIEAGDISGVMSDMVSNLDKLKGTDKYGAALRGLAEATGMEYENLKKLAGNKKLFDSTMKQAQMQGTAIKSFQDATKQFSGMWKNFTNAWEATLSRLGETITNFSYWSYQSICYSR